MTPHLAPGRQRSILTRVDHVDAADADDRGDQRHRRIAVATVAGLGARVLSAVAFFAAVPLAAARLDSAELGIWTLLVTAVALIGVADLGLGNGMVNHLSGALGRGDRGAAQRAVSTAAAALTGLAVVGVLGALMVVPRVAWADLLGLDRGQVPHLTPALAVFAGVVLVSAPLGIGQRIHVAYQQGWAASATAGLGSAAALLATVVAWAADASLPWFVAAMLVPPAAANALETAWVLVRSHTDLRPARGAVDTRVLRSILRSGFLFFVLALAGALAYQSDAFVISRYLGAEAVTDFGVALRLALLVPSGLTAAFLPLWPAYGEALGRQDHAWVRATLRRSIRMALVVSTASSLAILVLARPLLDAVLPGVDAPSYGLLAALGAWAIVSTVSVAISVYLNGANVVRLQVVAACAMTAANLGLSILLVEDLGPSGPVLASVVTQVVLVLVPEAVVVRRRLRQDDGAGEPVLVPSPLATWLVDAICREVRGANRALVRRPLMGVRRLWSALGDPPIRHELDGTQLVLPLSHALPVHRARHAGYSANLGDVAGAIASARPEATMVDIGANVGDSVAIVRRTTGMRMLCVEGDAVYLPYLRHNVRGLGGHEVAACYVATDTAGAARMTARRENGTARLVEATDGTAVGVVPLLDVLRAHPAFAGPTLLKLDTDGHDAAILRTAMGVLTEVHPVLFFEHDPALAAAVGAPDPSTVFELLADLGYRTFVAYANTGEHYGTFDATVVESLGDTAAWRTADRAYLDICAVHGDDADLEDVILATTGVAPSYARGRR